MVLKDDGKSRVRGEPSILTRGQGIFGDQYTWS